MPFITSPELTKLGIIHGYFTAEDGASEGSFDGRNVKHGIGGTPEAVEQNRSHCISELAADSKAFVYTDVVHKTDIYQVTDDTKDQTLDDYDVLVTDRPGVVIGLATADCLPILLTNKSQTFVAVIHAGWRGLKLGVIDQTVQYLEEKYHISADDMVAGIGPAIHRQSYEVGPEVGSQFDDKFVAQDGQSLKLDLIGVANQQLNRAGIVAVDDCDIDTAQDERFYSYRQSGGTTGRQLSAIMMPLR